MTASPHTPDIRTIGTAREAAAAWRQALAGDTSSSPAHSPEWFEVIRTAYGHDPQYLTAQDENGRTAVLPSFVVRCPVLGTVVTSMPFLDTGGPCGGSAHLATLLVRHLVEEARRIGARSVELRCTEPVDVGETPLQHKVNLVLGLTDADALWRKLDKTVRNQVRKAERAGLTVETGGVDKLDEFYT